MHLYLKIEKKQNKISMKIIEQGQDKKKPVTRRRRNTIKTSCFNLAITLILFVLASDNLIGTFILYCKIQECRLTVETTKWRQASSIHFYLKCK